MKLMFLREGPTFHRPFSSPCPKTTDRRSHLSKTPRDPAKANGIVWIPHLGTPMLKCLVSSRWCCNTSAVTDKPLFGWSQLEREGLTSPTGLT